MVVNDKRIYWIDLCKLFFITLVAIYHVPPKIDGTMDDWCYYLVNTPFFFLSGYCFNSISNIEFTSYILKKARTLLRPVICFFVLFYALWMIGGRTLANDESINWYNPIIELLTGQLKTIIAPMWFIIALFVMQPVYFVLSRHLSSGNSLILSTIVSCISMLMSITHFWQINNVLFYLPIYALGQWYKQNVSKQIPYWICILLCLISIGVMSILKYDSIPYLLALCPVLSVYTYTWVRTTFKLFNWIDTNFKHKQWISDLGRNTIILLAFHIYVIGVTKVALNHIFSTTNFLEEHYLLKFPIGICSILILYPAVILINRYLPWIIGKKEQGKQDFKQSPD